MYGEWDALKMEVRKAWQFRFDWFIKSRTTIELSKRCEVLMRMIEKENQDIEEKARERERQREADKRKKDADKVSFSSPPSSPSHPSNCSTEEGSTKERQNNYNNNN